MAGSYAWSHLRQSVTLVSQLRKMGVNKEVAEEFLDGAPPLAFSVYYGGRSDCASEVKVIVLKQSHFQSQSLTVSISLSPRHRIAARQQIRHSGLGSRAELG